MFSHTKEKPEKNRNLQYTTEMQFRSQFVWLLTALLLAGCSRGATAVSPPVWLLWFGSLLLLALLSFALFRWNRYTTIQREEETRLLIRQRTAEIERRRQIAEGLREILVILNSEQSLADSLHYIVTQAARLTDAADAIIFRRNDEAEMVIVATNPGGQIRYSVGETLLAITHEWATELLPQKRPFIIPELARYWQTHPGLRPTTLQTYRALLGIPIFVSGQPYGGLLLFYLHPRSFSDEDLELGATFADQGALAIANAQLRERAEETAVIEERTRLARDLHDAVTQTLFSASLIAESLPAMWQVDPEEGAALLHDLQQLTRGALAEMRTLLLELRPSVLAEAALGDLLQQLATAVSGRSGVRVQVDLASTQTLPVNVRISLYRIVQEALNNVIKHARATQVVVNLRDRDDDTVILQIIDNGRGFDADRVPPGHHGLSIMRERAEAAGASLVIESEPGSGTRVTAVWPDEANG